jgi:simple sugar transport system ATP-binding protein
VTAEVDDTELAALMMGATGAAPVAGPDTDAALGLAVGPVVEHAAADAPRPVLEVEGLTLTRGGRDVLREVTLRVAAGEILGVAGVSGNGQTELVSVLGGTESPTAGSVVVAGDDVTRADVATRLRAGLGRLTEDRRGSVVPQLTVEQNLVLEDLPRYTRRGLLDRRAVRRHAEELIERFDIRARPGDPIALLSGGNMQKVLLARALSREPRILVASQPTRGLDIGAYRYVHGQLRDLRARGGGVLLVSEDLDELRSLSDRIVVLFDGEVAGELRGAEATPERLGVLMAGGVRA